jgi:hypothetical protein
LTGGVTESAKIAVLMGIKPMCRSAFHERAHSKDDYVLFAVA